MVSRFWQGWVLIVVSFACGPKSGPDVPPPPPPTTDQAEIVAEAPTPGPAPPAAPTSDEPTMIVTFTPDTRQAYRWYVAAPPDKLPQGEPGEARPMVTPDDRYRSGGLGLYAGGWVLDFTDLGYTVIGEHRGKRSWSTSLAHPSGPRVMLEMHDARDRLQLSARAVTRPLPPPPLPGPCVPVPEVEFQIKEKIGDGMFPTWYFTRHELDLDGDGVLDAQVPLASGVQCGDDVRYALYVMRGACGHRVGTVGPGLIASNDGFAPTAGGLKPLRTWIHRYTAGKIVKGERNYTFATGTYRESDAKQTEEPCDVCKAQVCTGPQPIPDDE